MSTYATTNQAAYAATVLRLSLGAMYLAHGLLKLLVFTPSGTAGFFASLGLPALVGPLTMVLEIMAGVLLVVGYQTRWVATALLPVLIGSIIFVHGANGWGFSNEGGGWEYPLFLIAASVAAALLGDGAYAIGSRKTEAKPAVA